MIKNILLVGFGGGLGSIARWLCQKWFSENHPQSFPWSTFIINLTGCFLIGVIYEASEKSLAIGPLTRLLLIPGFCAGFTTFSTFAYENMLFLRSGDLSYFLIYTFGSVLLGIIGVFGGIAFMKLL
jgi:CrcB protein